MSVRTPIPLLRVELDPGVLDDIRRVIESGWLIRGDRVAEFEEALGDYVGGGRKVLAMNSCTAALHLALQGRGIGPGDDVICPSLSFVASANCIFHAGARPVFADIDPVTFNLDPSDVDRRVTERTRALVVVHQVGLPADNDALYAIARRRGLAVIEDAACAIGSTYRGKRIGAAGQAVTFSFHPRKPITTGEGGALVTDDEALYEYARSAHEHGANVSNRLRHLGGQREQEGYTQIGYNYRMNEIAAVIGLNELGRIEAKLAGRRAVAERYAEELGDVQEVILPTEPEGCGHNWQSYIIRFRGGNETRETVFATLADAGIASMRGIPPIHKQPYIRRMLGDIELPETERASAETLFVPIFPGLSGEEVATIAGHIRNALTG